MGNDSMWFRQNVDWWEREWALVLSSEARLCWVLLLGRVCSVGQKGVLHKTPIALLARQWLVGEESIRQMLTAVVMAGELLEDEDTWEVADRSIFQKDPSATERKQAQRERQKMSQMSRDTQDVTDVTTQHSTTQHSTEPPKSPKGDKEKVGKFQKPTLAECFAYAAEKNLPESEAERFYDFHESKGWKVGFVSMKDWKAAMRTWKRNWQEKNPCSSKKTRGLEDVRVY